jgi:hypothetical protein
MKVVIENQIFNPVHVYAEILKFDEIIIEKCDNYQKRTFRNRFSLVSPQGMVYFSIPLKKGKNSLKFVDVEISYDNNWIRSLANAMRSYYSSSPFFDHYFARIIEVFEKEENSLFELNNSFRELVFELLEIEKSVTFTSEYLKQYNGINILDLREACLPVKNTEISSNIKPYPQVYEDKLGFIANASILDLLFNMGKSSIFYL